MRKNFLTVMAVALLVVGLTACSGGDNAFKFSTYEARNGEAVITIDIPQGEGEKQQNVSKGILDIMAHSAIAKEAGEPKTGNLKEVADDYSKRMAELLNSGDYGPATADLTIEASYLNEASVTFHVYDGVYVNGEPDVYDQVVRLSDGHVMEQSEMVDISAEDLQPLIEKNLKEEMPVYLEDGYWILPAGTDSCRVFWLISRADGGEVKIPISEMESFLTPEGKSMFTAKPTEFTKSSGDESESGEESAEETESVEEGETTGAGALSATSIDDPVELTKIILDRFVAGNFDISDCVTDNLRDYIPLMKQYTTERGGLKGYSIISSRITSGDNVKVEVSMDYKRAEERETFKYKKTADGWKMENNIKH